MTSTGLADQAVGAEARVPRLIDNALIDNASPAADARRPGQEDADESLRVDHTSRRQLGPYS